MQTKSAAINHIMSCCPKVAWGELKNPNYQEKGKVEKVELCKQTLQTLKYCFFGNIFFHFQIGDLDIYYVGQGPKCIIWNYDIFGFDGGRSRQTCDLVADAGMKFYIPQIFK